MCRILCPGKALAEYNRLLGVLVSINKAAPAKIGDADKVEDVVGWLGKCNTRGVESLGQAMDRQLNKLIEDNNLPDGWKRMDGQDPIAWRASHAKHRWSFLPQVVAGCAFNVLPTA